MSDDQYIRQVKNSQHQTNVNEAATKTGTDRDLRQIFEGGRNPGEDPLSEIINIFTSILPGNNTEFLEETHENVTDIFNGRYKNFKHSPTKYHDLRHTRNVTLATVRLLHGLILEKKTLPADLIEFCIICAYFHDTGMLLTHNDTELTGAAHLKYHEERSIRFLCDYLEDTGKLTQHLEAVPEVINCTNLTVNPESIVFESEDYKTIGSVLGSADILAQMADRYYLESLPLLYQEQLDAGLEKHSSSLELMRRTTCFYHEVIEHRLKKSFDNTCRFMQTHFRKWWGLDRNLYLEHIERNILYLEKVVQKHDKGEGGIYNYLRRKQPVAR